MSDGGNSRSYTHTPMLSWAIRYRPIVDELRRLQPSYVLEVGSGPEGLSLMWSGRVIGTDLSFKRRPLHWPAVASGLSLPMADRSVPVVVSCDMLEHIPPSLRQRAVGEMARVADQHILLVFPSGQAASAIYQRLLHDMAPEIPSWLTEHIENGLPDATLVRTWLEDQGWTTSIRWYESAETHRKMVLWEQRGLGKLLSYTIMRAIGRWLGPRLPVPSGGEQLRVCVSAFRR